MHILEDMQWYAFSVSQEKKEKGIQGLLFWKQYFSLKFPLKKKVGFRAFCFVKKYIFTLQEN